MVTDTDSDGTDSISLDDLPNIDDPTRRDRWGRYLVVPPQGGDPTGYTRATTIAKVLDSGGGLASWKAAMALTGMMLRPGLRAQWESLMAREAGDPWYHSPEGKKACKKLVEDCAAVGGSRDRAQIGLALHAISALIDKGKSPALSPETSADINAYQTGLVAAGITLVPNAIELCVVLDTYKVAGTFDRLVRVPGRELPLISDLKTGSSLDYSMQSFAVQLAIYSRGEAIYEQGLPKDGIGDVRHPMPAVDQDYGLILWLPAGTAELNIYEVDLQAGWEAFEHSMWTRGWRSQKVSQKLRPGPSDLEKQLQASIDLLNDGALPPPADLGVEYERPQVVATAQSRRGGRLDCGHMAKAGENIFKVDSGDRGGTTSRGNGLGGWICMPCAHGQPAPEVGSQLPTAFGSWDAMEKDIQAIDESNDGEIGTADTRALFQDPAHREWLQARIDEAGKHPQARVGLQRMWPEGVLPLKHSTEHTVEQICAIERLLDDIERRYELPFPAAPPRLEAIAVGKILEMFPGSSIQPTNPKGNAS